MNVYTLCTHGFDEECKIFNKNVHEVYMFNKRCFIKKKRPSSGFSLVIVQCLDNIV